MARSTLAFMPARFIAGEMPIDALSSVRNGSAIDGMSEGSSRSTKKKAVRLPFSATK